MSTTMVSAFYDVDVLYQQRKNLSKVASIPMSMAMSSFTDPKLAGNQMGVNTFPRARGFNTSTASQTSLNTLNILNVNSAAVPTLNSLTAVAEAQDRANRAGNRYKSELCRPFEENGHCKYGDKCQFAHGSHELRSLSRHPKYKTELCRTFHTVGFCPYGPRCHFIHSEDERKLCELKQYALQKQFSQIPQIQHSQSQPIQRPKTLPYSMNSASFGSTADSQSSSLSSSPQSTYLEDAMNAMNKMSLLSSPSATPRHSSSSSSSTSYLQQLVIPSALEMWLLNQRNNTETLVRDEVFSAPPSPPSSPVHSTSTLSSCSSVCNSPVSDKGLRLPIFRRLSLDDY